MASMDNGQLVPATLVLALHSASADTAFITINRNPPSHARSNHL